MQNTADMTFEEYLDLVWSITEDESLSIDEQEAKIKTKMTDRGISEERQNQLGLEFLNAFVTQPPGE
jgi:hypothetical protein